MTGGNGGYYVHNHELSEFWERRCQHPTSHVVKTKIANGATQYRKECDVCWHLFGPAVSRFDAAGTFREPDLEKRRAYEEARKAEERLIKQRFADQQAGRTAEWWDWYNAYLTSDAWYARRAKVLRRAGGMCEGCATARATMVHHLTYKHVGNELLWELRAVCDDCHDICHDGSDER